MTTTRDAPATSEPTLRRFSVEEYYRMAEVGILGEDDRVELIDGVIVQLPPIGSEHAGSVDSIVELFHDRVRPLARIRAQNPVRLDDRTEPEPDVAVVRRPEQREQSYRSQQATPADVFLLIEVSDTTLRYDLGEKALMYSQAGIAEYWVVDLLGDRLVVHREPTPSGSASVAELRRGQTVSPLAFPDVAFSVDEILG